MKKFLRGFHFVIISEGGTNDDPLDRGGLTNWGISQKQYPNVDIESLTMLQARDIYIRDYWKKNRCGDMHPDLGVIMFDCGVNCGQGSAAKWLQKACNKLGSKLVEDGLIGNKTIMEVYKYHHNDLQNLVLGSRLRRYVDLLKKHPQQKRFIRGWIDRVSNLLDFITLSNPAMFKK